MCYNWAHHKVNSHENRTASNDSGKYLYFLWIMDEKSLSTWAFNLTWQELNVNQATNIFLQQNFQDYLHDSYIWIEKISFQ